MAENAFMLHHADDDVAVAVEDLLPGDAEGYCLGSNESRRMTVRSAVPLGHKFALRDIATGTEVRKYGVVIGLATADIAVGDYVHVHNLRSARWQTSI